MIDRREALKQIAFLVGGTLSSSTLAGALSPRHAHGGAASTGAGAAAWTPQALSGDQVELVATLADLVIPRTDTPGARDAGVHEFIDLLLAEWMDDAERASFMDGLEDVEKKARKRYKAAFADCTEEEQTELLAKLEAKALKIADKRRKKELPPPFFLHLKELTLVGYYTSEPVASEEHVIVFDTFDGCVPLAEAGAAGS